MLSACRIIDVAIAGFFTVSTCVFMMKIVISLFYSTYALQGLT